MNKYLKKILIVAIAVCCALSVQLSVSALSLEDLGDPSKVQDWISSLFPSTQPTDPAVTTTVPQETTTTPQETTTSLINNSGEGNVNTPPDQTTAPTTQYTPVTMPTTAVTTTETTTAEETSLSFEASLSDLFEEDSANVIIQAPTEPYTIGGLVVNDNNKKDDGFSWQQIALVAAAVLFVILLALVIALLVQRSRKSDDDYVPITDSDGEPSGPVSVEVMTPERIAELLGSAGKNSAAGGYGELTGEEAAAAIKTAALMGQLSHSYSDPLIRKYTDEPVMISPSAASAFDSEDATAEDILRATDSMLDDITGDEKYATDLSGLGKYIDTDIDLDEAHGPARKCPDCGNDVPADDVFCHQCGTYIG